MTFEKGNLLYEGKGKRIFAVKDHSEFVWMDFKDDLTAFNAEKKGSFESKGRINCQIATLIFNFLDRFKVPHHSIETVGSTSMVVKKLQIVPLEVVVRNIMAGSTAKKLGIQEGVEILNPLVEFYYKDDDLGDPFLSDEQALYLKAVEGPAQLNILKSMALEINGYLKKLFLDAEIRLIDFKLEFGRNPQGEFILADEITPDSCRLWDVNTGEKMDKDRFRRDLGGVEQGYQNVLKRLSSSLEGESQ